MWLKMRNISNRVSTIYYRVNNAIIRPKAYKWKITILILIFPSPVCFIMLIFSSHVAEFFPIQVFYVADCSSPVFNVAPSQQGDVVWMLPEEKRQPRLLGI